MKKRRQGTGKGRRQFLLLSCAALMAAAAGRLRRSIGLPQSGRLPRGREARWYRRIGRRKGV